MSIAEHTKTPELIPSIAFLLKWIFTYIYSVSVRKCLWVYSETIKEYQIPCSWCSTVRNYLMWYWEENLIRAATYLTGELIYTAWSLSLRIIYLWVTCLCFLQLSSFIIKTCFNKISLEIFLLLFFCLFLFFGMCWGGREIEIIYYLMLVWTYRILNSLDNWMQILETWINWKYFYENISYQTDFLNLNFSSVNIYFSTIGSF